MNQIYADIILFDTVNLPFTGEIVEKSGIGGSELQAIFLLEEFAKIGKKVICLNNIKEDKLFNNVLYISNTNIHKYIFKCDHLILHRNSHIPNKIYHKKCYQWITDNNNDFNLPYYNLIENNKCKLITLSKYSYNQYPENWNKHIINFMIPDWIYNYEIPEIKKNYVYASSIMKGYWSTFNHWVFIKNNYKILENKSLNVCLPGYDNPQENISAKEFDVNYLGTLTLKQVVELISKSEGMFYVNLMQETFCISAVLCEILKTPPYIYCMNGFGALNEVLNSETLATNAKQFIDNFQNKNLLKNPKDYRNKIILENWLKLMNSD